MSARGEARVKLFCGEERSSERAAGQAFRLVLHPLLGALTHRMKKQWMAKHHESVHDGRAVHEDEYGPGKDASVQGEVGEKWADRLYDQSVSSPHTIPAHGVAPPPHEPAAQGAGSVLRPAAGSFAPSSSNFPRLDAFLAQGASPLTAQLLTTGQLKPATSHGAVDAQSERSEQQPPEPTAEPKKDALTRNDKDAENSPRGSGFNGASASGSSSSVSDVCPASVSLHSHGTQRVMPSVSKVTKDGDAKNKAPELKGVAAAPVPAAKNTQKSPEAHKDMIGPLRGAVGPGANSPRPAPRSGPNSPRSSHKWPMSGNDTSKQAKMKSEGKAEVKSEVKSSQAVPKLEREQLQRPTHDGASHLRDKGEMAGKLDGQNSSKASAQGVAAATGEKGGKKASREGKQKTSKGNANSAAIKDQDSILVCVCVRESE